jgi:hypothetical protein
MEPKYSIPGPHDPAGARGSIVVKALCYKPEGHGFETRWSEWFLSSYLIPPAVLGPGVHSASNRNSTQIGVVSTDTSLPLIWQLTSSMEQSLRNY